MEKMNVVRDVLDGQLIDRHQFKMGKVDGIVMELSPGKPPRLVYLEAGFPTLAQRLHPQLAKWVVALQSKWGVKRGDSLRIPFSLIRDARINVEVDLEADQTAALDWEKWLSQHVTQRIPGGK